MERSMAQRLTAEFVGALALVFIGAGSIVASTATGINLLLGVAIAYGLAIATMVTAMGHISGAHFNPAVTAGAWVAQKISAMDALLYMLAQLVGAVAGAALLRFALPEALWKASNIGIPTLGGNISSGQAILIEAILTFFLVWVVFATAIDPEGAFGKIAGLAIGLTITADILVGGPFTGAAMNPARWFGPALMTGQWSNALVWIIGPIAGGVIAASLYDMVLLRPRGTGGSAEPGEAPHAWGAHGADPDAVTTEEQLHEGHDH